MKLDARNIRHLSQEDWRVLTAVEQGSRNHQIVPTPLIINISSLPSGKSHVPRHISTLAKLGLIARVKNARYDGYRLTYGGLDYLALHAHSRADVLSGVGERIGVGKEADIMIVSSPSFGIDGQEGAAIERVMKMHRLGRVSFRTVKTNRDYLRRRTAGSGSWMYLSRLAAQKEFAVLKALWDAGFEVPQPVACNRHTIVMERIEGIPLRQVAVVPNPAVLYEKLIDMILRLAGFGLIHGDFNEFNIMITEIEIKSKHQPDSQPSTDDSESTEESSTKILLRPILIDFPQTLSTSHPNADQYFARDVSCVKRFFSKRFGYEVPESAGPTLADVVKDPQGRRLDVEVEASGFTRKMAKELEGYLEETVLKESDQEEEDQNEEHDEEDEEFDDDYAFEQDDQDDLDTQPPDEEEDELPELNSPQHPIQAMKKLSVLGKNEDAVSVAGSMRSTKSRKPPPNPAKVASGWAI